MIVNPDVDGYTKTLYQIGVLFRGVLLTSNQRIIVMKLELSSIFFLFLIPTELSSQKVWSTRY